jgi:hypothetical protein
MCKIKLFVEKENNVAGSKRHGVMYPTFSSWTNGEKLESVDSENYKKVLYRKLTIEDGEFENAYGKKHAHDKYSYMGQHTNLYVKLENGINENAPRYIYGDIFSRTKYGSQKREFRLDTERAVIQIQRKDKWYDFQPKNYLD